MAKKIANPKEEIKTKVSSEKTKRESKEALKTDLHAVQKKAERKRVGDNAQAALNLEYVSDAAKQVLLDLQSEIAYKKSEIEELCGIETEGTKMADMISAHNILQAELEEQHEADKKAIAEEKARLENEKKEAINALTDEFNKARKNYLEQDTQYKNDLRIAREREAEEYKYNLDRERSKENDAWNDEKAAREKVLGDREEAVTKRESEVALRESKMDDLETKVSQIPSLIDEATKEGKAAGKAEAEKANAFDKRYMTKEHENEVNLLKSEVTNLTKENDSLKEANKELQKKLDDAYIRNQELATTVAKNSGTTKIVTESSSNK